MSEPDNQNPNLAQFFFEAEEEIQREPEQMELLKKVSSKEFPYITIAPLDEGGMKCIYRALDRRTRREVALALIKCESFNEKDYRYFMNEAWITANLQHPNIVPIYDIGVDLEDNPYFTMKLLEGETLQVILQKLHKNDPQYLKKYTQNRLLEIFKKICEAASFAHDKAVAHLDLKPENIHISKFGEVLVLDWGISKLLKRYHFPDTPDELPELGLNKIEQTFFGAVRGTPGYMAPEQMNPDQKIDHRADIYGLGAILYSLMTYQRPEVKMGSIGQSITYKKEPLNTEAIPVAIRSVIERAMEKNPDNRYQSCDEIINELESYQNNRATEAENAGFFRLLSLLIKRNKGLISGISIGAIILSTLTLAFISELKDKEQRALKNEQQAIVNEQRALNKEKEAMHLLHKWEKEKKEREKSDKTSANYYLKKARQAYQECNTNELIVNLDKAIKLAPKNPEVIHFKLEFLIMQQQFVAATNFINEHDHLNSPSGFSVVNKRMRQLKSNDKIKLNDETFKQFITTLKEEGCIVFTNFMQNVFLYQHQGQLFNKRASYIEELFSLLNPNASLTYDPEKDRVKISGTPILTYTPVSGLIFKGLDLQGTSFSESYFLNSVMNLEYLNLSRTGLINIHPVYSMKNLKHLDISGTPIRSLLVHNSHIKMDYLNLSSTLLTNYKGKQREVDTVDLSNCYSLDPISIFTVAYPPKTVILNESQIAQYPDFYIKAEKKNIRIILN